MALSRPRSGCSPSGASRPSRCATSAPPPGSATTPPPSTTSATAPGLVAAVFERRMRVVNERRHAMLDALEPAGATADVGRLVAAIVVPLTEVVAESDGWYGRFLARTQWDTFAARRARRPARRRQLPPGARPARRAALDLPADLRRRTASTSSAGCSIGTVAGWEWQGQRGEPGARRRRSADRARSRPSPPSSTRPDPTRRSIP